MTLKEKVEEMESDHIRDGFGLVVNSCPFEFKYLNQPYSICPRDGRGIQMTCKKCWDRKYKEDKPCTID